MTNRVLVGKHPVTGIVRFDVSKSGQDVLTSDKMHLALSSEMQSPQVVVSGQVVINPSNGYRAKDNGVPGALESVSTILFGRTISPAPIGFIVGNAAGWNFPIIGGGEMFPYLDGQWHTPIFESGLSATATVKDRTYANIPLWRVPDGAGGDADGVSMFWKCCAFFPSILPDRLEIHAACSSAITVKYLVLDYT